MKQHKNTCFLNFLHGFFETDIENFLHFSFKTVESLSNSQL